MNIQLQKTSKRILVSPLNWGLGHASRLIPVIEELENQGKQIIIAADKLPLKLLRKEFPDLKHIQLVGTEIHYSKGNNQFFSILKFLPAFAKSIKKEHKQIEKIIRENEIDTIISDNRYGLWNKNVFSVIITHQLKLKLPFYFAFAEGFIKYIIKKLTQNFDEIWIPDFPDKENNLSGNLSHFKHNYGNRLKYIGILSKFQSSCFRPQTPKRDLTKKQIAVILSGPEPQRTIFQNILIKKLQNTNYYIKFVLGKNVKLNELPDCSNIEFIAFAGKQELYTIIQSSEFVISRAGYSTIMDLFTLNKKAILVPTPGQTEQEYLAKHLADNDNFKFIRQSTIFGARL